MTTSHPPYAQPQAQPQQPVLTRGAAAKLRTEAIDAEAKSRKFLTQRGVNEQQIVTLKSECESLARLSAAMDATAASYRALLDEAGHPQEEPAPQWDGPQTGIFQDPALAKDPDAALRLPGRPSQARDAMPPAREGK